MSRYGLIGNPISHSLSPALFKAGYHGRYIYDLIETADFEQAYKIFLEQYDAVNVTAPFKELAFRKADLCTNECAAIGAANILIKTPKGILADNSDCDGVLGAIHYGLSANQLTDQQLTGQQLTGQQLTGQQLTDQQLTDSHLVGNQLCDKSVLVVGCGGAAKASVYACASRGMKVFLINRDSAKAEAFANHLNGLQMNSIGSNLEESNSLNPIAMGEIVTGGLYDFYRYFLDSQVLIYCIPVPLPFFIFDDGSSDSRSVKDYLDDSLYERKVIVEANYRDPYFTPEVLERWRGLFPGVSYVDGRKWLLYQGVGAYRAFTGEEPDIMTMSKVL